MYKLKKNLLMSSSNTPSFSPPFQCIKLRCFADYKITKNNMKEKSLIIHDLVWFSSVQFSMQMHCVHFAQCSLYSSSIDIQYKIEFFTHCLCIENATKNYYIEFSFNNNEMIWFKNECIQNNRLLHVLKYSRIK